MSTPLTPSAVAPAFAEQFTELETCDLPLHILESAARLGQATLSLDAHEASVREANAEKIIIPGGEAAGSDRICSGLIASGMLSEGDLAHVEAVAQAVIEQDREALEDAVIDSYAAFKAGFLSPDRVTAKDRPMWRLFSVAKHVAERTDQCLLMSGALRAGRSLFYEQKAWLTEYAEESDQPRLIEHPAEENIDTLRALSMVDVIASVLRLPDNLVTDPRKQGDQADLRPILMAGLASRLDSMSEFSRFPVGILQTGDERGLKRLLKIAKSSGEVRTCTSKLAGILVDYQQIEKYAEAHQAVRDAVAVHNEASAAHIQARGDTASQSATQALHQLDQFTKEYVVHEPSSERVLGALSVENWIQRVVPTSYSRSAQKAWQERHQGLHEAVEKAAYQDQLTELNYAAEPLRAEIQSIDEKHTITARALRQLPDGLGLRRDLGEYLQSSSRRAVFMQDQAQQLAGLALQLEADPEKQHGFIDDVVALRQAWTGIEFLQGKDAEHAGLMRTLDLLVECYENAPETLLSNPRLQSVWQLARLSQQAPSIQELSTDSE